MEVLHRIYAGQLQRLGRDLRIDLLLCLLTIMLGEENRREQFSFDDGDPSAFQHFLDLFNIFSRWLATKLRKSVFPFEIGLRVKFLARRNIPLTMINKKCKGRIN